MSEQEVKTVKQFRSKLKKCIHYEIQNLSETLKGLESRDRLEMLVKLMYSALPESGKISPTYGEPSKWDLD